LFKGVKMLNIILEGGIAAGKTTLTKKLSEALDATPFFEPVETNPYLELYYKDRHRYALPMQFYLMSNRFEMHQKGIEYAWKQRKITVFDRSIYGDFVFAKRNWLDGYMTTLDFDNYNKMRTVMFKHLMVPHITIYLKCSPETCLERLKMRARTCEVGIPLDYLKGLNDLYKELMYELKQMGSNVIEVDWEEFKPTEYIIERIKPFI